MAHLAEFGSLEWFAGCKKKASPPPAKPATPARSSAGKQLTRSWTQTPAGGIPAPPHTENAVAKLKAPNQRDSKYWKRFYRQNQQLLKGSYSAKLWSTFSGLEEAKLEPKRSKFYRAEFRKHPKRYLHGYNAGDDSCSEDSDEESNFDSNSEDDSDSDTSASDTDALSDWDSDDEADIDRRIRNARKRKIAMEKNRRREMDGGSSGKSTSRSSTEKHVHWSSDGEGKPKSILKKKNADFESTRSRSAGQVEEEMDQEEQSYRVQSETKVNVNVVQGDSRSPRSASEGRITDQPRGTRRPQNNPPRQSSIAIDNGPGNISLGISHRVQNNNRAHNRNSQHYQNNTSDGSFDKIDFVRQFLRSIPARFDYDFFRFFENKGSFRRLSRTADYDEFDVHCPFCSRPLKPEFYNNFNSKLSNALDEDDNMATSANSRCILPLQAHVVLVEHVLENSSDPRPNAFFDARTGMVRIYHGNLYGNPNGRILPVHAEQMLSSLGSSNIVGTGFGELNGQAGGAAYTDYRPVGTYVNGQPTRWSPSMMPAQMRLSPVTMPAQMRLSPVTMPAQQMMLPQYGHMGIGQAPMHGDGMNMGMNSMGMNDLLNGMSNMNMNLSPLHSPSFQNHNNGNGNYGGGNQNNGGNNGNRDFSNNSRNWNENQNQNQNQNQTQGNQGNQNHGNQGNQQNNHRGHNHHHNKNQSRNHSQSGGSSNGNNNGSSHSTSGNANNGGGNSWGGGNSNSNSGNPAPDDTWASTGTSAPAPDVFDPPSAIPPSPTPTVIRTISNDGASSERLVVDGNITPTNTFTYMPCAYPDSAKKNANNNNDNSNNSSGDPNDNTNGNTSAGPTWDENANNDSGNMSNNDSGNISNEDSGNMSINDTPYDPGNSTSNDVAPADNDDWGSGFDTNTGLGWNEPETDTVLSAGSWKSPPPKDEKENKTRNQTNGHTNSDGYNLKQTNVETTNATWGDPTAAQKTGGVVDDGW